MIHQGWQNSVHTLAENVRLALKASQEEGLAPYKREVAALRRENTMLREKVGWEPPDYTQDDEELEEAERGRRASAMAQPQQAQQGT